MITLRVILCDVSKSLEGGLLMILPPRPSLGGGARRPAVFLTPSGRRRRDPGAPYGGAPAVWCRRVGPQHTTSFAVNATMWVRVWRTAVRRLRSSGRSQVALPLVCCRLCQPAHQGHPSIAGHGASVPSHVCACRCMTATW